MRITRFLAPLASLVMTCAAAILCTAPPALANYPPGLEPLQLRVLEAVDREIDGGRIEAMQPLPEHEAIAAADAEPQASRPAHDSHAAAFVRANRPASKWRFAADLGFSPIDPHIAAA